jgi:Raf kinase inhibitor-like YbhB/YbcL family protein
MTLELTSPAFSHGATIPDKYTCDGPDVSPPLAWKNAPANTKSFALVMEDPDAPGGTFSHWVIYDLPSSVTYLPEGVAKQDIVRMGGKVGRNDFGKETYGGSCPPPGRPHRYNFYLYALSDILNLPAGATRQQLFARIQKGVVADAVLMGRYGRKTVSAPA